MDPLTRSYPWYTPYQFAGNTPIQAIDLDGLEEYKVNIFSPEISRNFKKSLDNQDIIAQRRLTYWALNNGFPDTWAAGKITSLEVLRENNAAKMIKIPGDEYMGTTVYLYSFFTKDDVRTDDPTKAFSIRVSDEIIFPPFKAEGRPLDATSPVDNNLWVGNGQVADGSDYYSEYQFEGIFLESNGISKGKGLAGGYLQGYGYLEFAYSMVGLGFPSNTIAGAITGNYIGAPSLEGFPSGADPFNFAGQGSSTTNFGITTWKGFGTNSINWIGEANGIGLSIPGIDELFSHSKFRTYTDILTGLGERQGYIWNKFYQKEE